MILDGFRTIEVEANDFPILLTIADLAGGSPKVASKIQVTYIDRKTAKSGVLEAAASLDPGTKNVSYTITRPPKFVSGAILFTLTAAIPIGSNAAYEVKFVSDDNQTAKDKIFPDTITPVFANYSMDLR